MGTGEYSYLILVVIAFTAFAVAAAFGIIKYRAWRSRRGGNTDTSSTGTPPSYPDGRHG